MSEELILDVLKLGLEFLSDLVFVLIVVLWLGSSLSSLSCEFKILLSSELTFKDLLHHFLLLRLESVVVKCTAKGHHGHGTITVTDSGHASVD